MNNKEVIRGLASLFIFVILLTLVLVSAGEAPLTYIHNKAVPEVENLEVKEI